MYTIEKYLLQLKVVPNFGSERVSRYSSRDNPSSRVPIKVDNYIPTYIYIHRGVFFLRLKCMADRLVWWDSIGVGQPARVLTRELVLVTTTRNHHGLKWLRELSHGSQLWHACRLPGDPKFTLYELQSRCLAGAGDLARARTSPLFRHLLRRVGRGEPRK